MSVVVKLENESDYDDCFDSKNQITEIKKERLETSISDENILGNFDYVDVKSDIKIKNELVDESEDQKPFIASLDNNFFVTDTIDSEISIKTELNEEFIIKDEISESDKKILSNSNSKRKSQNELSASSRPRYSRIVPKGTKVLPKDVRGKDIARVLAQDKKYRSELIKNKTIYIHEKGKIVAKVVKQDENPMKVEPSTLGDQNGVAKQDKNILPNTTNQNIVAQSNCTPFVSNLGQFSAIGQNSNVLSSVISQNISAGSNSIPFMANIGQFGSILPVTPQNLVVGSNSTAFGTNIGQFPAFLQNSNILSAVINQNTSTGGNSTPFGTNTSQFGNMLPVISQNISSDGNSMSFGTNTGQFGSILPAISQNIIVGNNSTTCATNIGQFGTILPTTQNIASGSNSMPFGINTAQFSTIGQNTNIIPSILNSLNGQNPILLAQTETGEYFVIPQGSVNLSSGVTGQNPLILGTHMSNSGQLYNLGTMSITPKPS